MTGSIPVKVAARLMEKSPQFVYKGLQDDKLPFGVAVKSECGGWNYFISIKKFMEFTGVTLQEIEEAS